MFSSIFSFEISVKAPVPDFLQQRYCWPKVPMWGIVCFRRLVAGTATTTFSSDAYVFLLEDLTPIMVRGSANIRPGPFTAANSSPAIKVK